ncbi:hypothetical protein D9M69_717330 [compost metagenome]
MKRMRAGAMNDAMPSTWPSVSTSAAWPGSQTILCTPSMRRNSASISVLRRPGLRFGCSRQLSVVSSVPCPST